MIRILRTKKILNSISLITSLGWLNIASFRFSIYVEPKMEKNQ